MIKETNKVYTTTDYNMFIMLSGGKNRPLKLNKQTYKNLKHSIKNKGIIQPILVEYDSSKGKYIIIDGQHRFTAAKDLNLPIEFINKDGLFKHLLDTQDGGTRSNWNNFNYVEKHISEGNLNYKRLNELLDKTYLGFKPKISTIEMLVNNRRLTTYKMQQGKLILLQSDVDYYKNTVAPKLKKISETLLKNKYIKKNENSILSVFFNSDVVGITKQLILLKKYNEKLFLNKLSKFESEIGNLRNKSDFMLKLIEFYNKNIRNDSDKLKINDFNI